MLAHDQLGKLLDDRKRTEELNALRIKLGLIKAREVKP